MPQQNTTQCAPAQRASYPNFVQRTAAAILHDLWDSRRVLTRLTNHANNLAIIAAEMETEYAALQAAADDEGDTELLSELAIVGAQYVELCRQMEIANKEITDTTNQITALATEASMNGGVRL